MHDYELAFYIKSGPFENMKKTIIGVLTALALTAAHAECLQEGDSVSLNGTRGQQVSTVGDVTRTDDMLTLDVPVCVVSKDGFQKAEHVGQFVLQGLHPRLDGLVQVTGFVRLIPTGRDYSTPAIIDVRESHRIGESGQSLEPPARARPTNAEYIANLRAKYGHRLHFQSAEAERIVRSFNINCRVPDGRYLPLINVLYARLAEATSDRMWQESFVQSRGGEVRVIDVLRGPGLNSDEGQVSFEVDKWGELHVHGITTEAVLNTCFGSYGPIWHPAR